jgi:outer membrane protein TolC
MEKEPQFGGKGTRGMIKLWIKWFVLLALLFGSFVFPGSAMSEDLLHQPGRPVTLQEVKAITLKFHPALLTNLELIIAAKAVVEQTLQTYYPNLNFNNTVNAYTTNFTSSSTPTTITGITSGSRYTWTFNHVYSSGLSFSQTIWDFGRTYHAVAQNQENVKVSEEALAITRLNVLLTVEQAYYTVLQTQRLIAVAQETVNQAKQHLVQAQGFFDAGRSPKIDVTNAQVNLSNANLNFIQARSNYEVAHVSLNNAMGLRRDLTFTIEDNLDYVPHPITLEEVLQAAYDKRPEIRQLKAQQVAQEEAIKVAQAANYPIFSANASFLNRSLSLDQRFYWDAFAGASFSIPLFNGFLAPNTVAQARATLRSLQAQEENTKLSIELESEQAFLALRVAEEQIQATKIAMGAAEENFVLATERYKVGVGSPLEVTDAEVSLANARGNYVNALYNFKVAEAKIKKAMGLIG